MLWALMAEGCDGNLRKIWQLDALKFVERSVEALPMVSNVCC